MRQFITVIASAALALSVQANPKAQNLWYGSPATTWNEALPIGNGRLAAMVFGNPVCEQFQINEETISNGSPYSNHNPDTPKYLDNLRQLIFSGRSDSAQVLAETQLMGPRIYGKGGAYQTAGSLMVRFADHGGYTGYRRSLSLDSALSTTTYSVGGVSYRQEAFTSLADQLLVIRYTASERGRLNFSASLTYPEGNPTRRSARGATLTMEGTTQAAGRAVPGKVRFVVDAKVDNEGGTVTAAGDSLVVSGADAVTIYVAMATNFVNYKDISADPRQRIDQYMAASNRPYAEAKAAHVARYKEQFDRVSLDLGPDKYPDKPTDERIRDFKDAADNYLVALYFQFGRYLLISSSQSGCQPANLQGKWNAKLNPAWRCRYTVNINTEMNYWPAEPCNLSELHEPLVRMVGELSQAGAATARLQYGCRGWVAHHNTDLWRMTGPVDVPYSGAWPMSGAWLCQHLWQRYLYNGDRDYLRSVYPYMKGAAEFFVDFMVTDPRNGHLVVCPSVSPENAPKRKPKANLYAGITMDNQLVADLFTNTAAAAAALGTDRLFADTLLGMRSRLIPLRIGKHGQLQEWADDWDSPTDHHRHVSHLWALYPGTEISPLRNPEAFDAARVSLTQRGDRSTGWSMGWKVCLWARLLDGDHAYKLIKDQLSLVPANVEKGQGGGTYPNMFDAHPPFQIDGNFGCTAGIAEMMVQSHDGAVFLLPAIPAEWADGEVSGLRTVGGFVIEKMKWQRGKLAEATIRSTIGGNLRLRSAVPVASESHTLKAADYAQPNPNPLFATWTMPVERVNPEGGYVPAGNRATGTTARNTHLYDVKTQPGDIITLKGI